MGDSVRWVQFLVFVWDDEKVPEMDGDVHSNVNVLMPLNCTVKHSENEWDEYCLPGCSDLFCHHPEGRSVMLKIG